MYYLSIKLKKMLSKCFLNARSLHKHNDTRTDLNYSSSDVSIFSETRLSHPDIDDDYTFDGYSLFRNDGTSTTNVRPLAVQQSTVALIIIQAILTASLQMISRSL